MWQPSSSTGLDERISSDYLQREKERHLRFTSVLSKTTAFTFQLNQRGFIHQVSGVRRRVTNVYSIVRVIGRCDQFIVVTILVDNLQSNRNCSEDSSNEYTYALDMSSFIVDEMDTYQIVLADTREQSVVIDKLCRSTIGVDEMRQEFLFGKIDLETSRNRVRKNQGSCLFLPSTYCHWAFEWCHWYAWRSRISTLNFDHSDNWSTPVFRRHSAENRR